MEERKIGVGRRLKEVRGERSLSEFASLLGVHKNSIARWEKEEGYPTIKMFLDICEQENINPNWLLVGEGEPYRLPIETQRSEITLSSRQEQKPAASNRPNLRALELAARAAACKLDDVAREVRNLIECRGAGGEK